MPGTEESSYLFQMMADEDGQVSFHRFMEGNWADSLEVSEVLGKQLNNCYFIGPQ